MNDQLREFEDQARGVGRTTLPREWRAEIVDAAMRDGERQTTTEESPPTLSEAIELMRRSTRRATWSVAACVVVILCLIALLLRPRSEPRAAQAWREEESARNSSASARLLEERTKAMIPHRAEFNGRYDHLSAVPLPPSPKAEKSPSAGPGNEVAQIEEGNGGFLIRDAAINDAFQMLAKRANKQYFHNTKIAGPEFKVRGQLKGDDPMQQMEDLASTHGLTVYQKGNTVYALNEDQLSKLPSEKLEHSLQSVRPNDVDKVKALIQPMLSPNGVANYEPKTKTIKGMTLPGDSSIGGVAADFGRPQPGRLGIRRKRNEVAKPKSEEFSPGKGVVQFEGQVNHSGKDSGSVVRPLDLVSGVDDEIIADNILSSPRRNRGQNAVPDEAGESVGNGPGEGRPDPTRRPSIVTTIKEPLVSNQGTEEVRYSVDTKDPVGDPATTREIGVTVAVTPTILADGTIRMKMRPRSAQSAEEVVGMSGNRDPRISESMRESIAQVPDGHSLVVGGYYGQVKPKESDKVPLLGDIPALNFYFEDEEAAQEPSDLLFVVTPTSLDGKVVVETKVLNVKRPTGGQTGVDWSSSLGEVGVPLESIGSLNSLFGINGRLEETAGKRPAAGPIVLSPAQVDGVLGALQNGGLVTQASNPTLITEDNEQATISLIDRVPIITTTVNEAEVSKKANEERQRQRELKALNESERNARHEPFSTFSLNVSDVSFKLAKAALARGEWPAADRIRVEEFVNAFDYGDPAASQQEKVACKLEQAAHPFLQQRNLVRVSMKTAALGRAAETPLRLTVLLDNSGSMDRADRLQSVKNAFRLLAEQLNPNDQVTLIGFARTPRLLADRLSGKRVAELANLVESTPSEGGTNLEQALTLGIAKAKEQMLEGGQNRIILLTDGAANLGNAKPPELAKLVANMRQQGIAFDACGVGADGLNDDILESLTRKGDGRYYFLDRPEDADEGFAKQIAGALRPTARNVKVQVNFNPNRVGRYKLYGFEKHLLEKEDFRNDSVDAAELAAEEAGNAIYQVEVLPEGSGQIGTVSVRFQDAESGRMIEWEWTIPYEAQVPRLEDSAPSLRLASSAALLGEKLKGSQIGQAVEMARLGNLINDLPHDFPADKRVKELVQMASKVRELSGE